jgi:hypothetical protein
MASLPHALQQFVIGDDWVIEAVLEDELGNPFDPTTSSSITWKLDDETGNTNLYTLTLAPSSNGVITIGAVPNSTVPGVIIQLVAAQTATLSPQTYRDQLRLVIGGFTSTFWQGPIQALQQLT